MFAVAALLLLAPRDVAAEVVYHGVCDGSAAVALDANHLVTASDEDNVLRLYRRGGGSTPVQVFDATPFLKVDPRHPESDLEGAARLGDVFFWISSHTLTRSGKDRPGRERLFATRFLRNEHGWRMEIVGRARADLLEFLTTDPGLSNLRLDTAATRAPTLKDALNIEGLCASPEGDLLIGFRNPIRGGKALLVPLRNPLRFVEGEPPEFGPATKLDLEGLGIRDMLPWASGYLVLAGAAHGSGDHELWFWGGGKAAPRRLRKIEPKDFNAEALVAYPGVADAVEILSDDGKAVEDGERCRDLPESQRQFRSQTLLVPKELTQQTAVPQKKGNQ